jgi:hypothetical protein
MKKLLAAALSIAFVIAFYPAASPAAATCADVESAKSMLKKQTTTTYETQAPRSLAGARSQDVQAPRSQDVQAPRSQSVQAPRSLELKNAATLVKEADTACNAGQGAMATEKAKAAMELLKEVAHSDLAGKSPRGVILWGSCCLALSSRHGHRGSMPSGDC